MKSILPTKTILLRSIERWLALLIGALSIYLGYRLFINLAEYSEVLSKGEGGADVLGMKITLSQVGPGVFFALFGAIVVWLSVRTQMKYEKKAGSENVVYFQPSEKEGKGVLVQPSTSVAFTYLASTERGTDKQALDAARGSLLRDFRAIDGIRSAMEKPKKDGSVSISKGDRTDFTIAVPRLKEALMLSVWDEDWGDYAKFAKWRKDGCKSPPPKDIEAPARFYLGQGK